jgi:hypothetical protein
MIDHADPERSKLLDMKKLRLDQCWRQKWIGDQTYLRSLFFMGYSSTDATTELNLLKLEKTDALASRN